MSITYAMLLDGGFLRHKLSSNKQPVDVPRIRAFVDAVANLQCLSGMRLHRIYFYDSAPLNATAIKPLGESG